MNSGVASSIVQRLLEQSSDACLVLDPALKVVACSSAAASLYGQARDTALGQGWTALASGRLPPDVVQTVEAGLATGAPFLTQVTVDVVDGASWRDVDLEATPLTGPGDTREGWLIVGRDMTAARVARALGARERQMDGVFNGIADGIVVLSPAGEIVASNAAAGRILGVLNDEMTGSRPEDERWVCIHEDGSPYPAETHPGSIVLRTGQPVRDAIMGVRRPDGSTAWININAMPLREPAGEGPWSVAATFTEITALKQAEMRESHAHERLSFALRGANDGFWDWDVPSGRLVLSERWYEILGLVPADTADVSIWSDRLHPDDAAAVMAVLDAHLRGETPFYESEHRSRHADGHWLWMHARGQVVQRNDEGHPIRVAGTYTDISVRKEAELALAERERQLSAFFLSPGVGVAFASLDGRFVRVNPKLCAMLGYTEEELLSKTWREISAPEDLPAHERPVRAMEAGEIDTFEVDKRYLRKDGTPLWSLTSVSCMRGVDGQITQRVVIIKDITARKNAEAAVAASARELRMSEARLRNVVDAATEAITLVDLRSGNVELANRRFCEILGLSAEEVVGRSALALGDRIHPDDRVQLYEYLMGAASGDATSRSCEHRLLTADGTYRWYALNHTVVTDAGRPVALLAVRRDITERRLAEEAIRRALASSASQVQALQDTLKQRTLAEFLPICMYCKSIRDDDGQWATIETYITQHTGSWFSHGLCPDCSAKFLDKYGEK